MPLEIPIGTVAPQSELEITSHQLSWRLNPAPFVALDEARLDPSIRLTVWVGDGGGANAVRDSSDIRLLTADEWWAVGIPEGLAAFVRPNDPAIAKLLTETSDLWRLRSRTHSPSLEEYQSGPERVYQIAETIYDAMAARGITYVEAPASFEGIGQRIRTHSEVLTERRGTCLDLACTFAAALEQAGIHPVLAVVDGHAFTGYLTDELPSCPPLRSPTRARSSRSPTLTCSMPLRPRHCANERSPSRWMQHEVRCAGGGGQTYRTFDTSSTSTLPTVGSCRYPPSGSTVGCASSRCPGSVCPRPRAEFPPLSTQTIIVAAHPKLHLASIVGSARFWVGDLNPLLKLKGTSNTSVHVPAGGLARLEDQIFRRTVPDAGPSR